MRGKRTILVSLDATLIQRLQRALRGYTGSRDALFAELVESWVSAFEQAERFLRQEREQEAYRLWGMKQPRHHVRVEDPLPMPE